MRPPTAAGEEFKGGEALVLEEMDSKEMDLKEVDFQKVGVTRSLSHKELELQVKREVKDPLKSKDSHLQPQLWLSRGGSESCVFCNLKWLRNQCALLSQDLPFTWKVETFAPYAARKVKNVLLGRLRKPQVAH